MTTTAANRPVRDRKSVTHYSDDNPNCFTVKKKRRKGDDGENDEASPAQVAVEAPAPTPVKKRGPGRPPGSGTNSKKQKHKANGSSAVTKAVAAVAAPIAAVAATVPATGSGGRRRGRRPSVASTSSLQASVTSTSAEISSSSGTRTRRVAAANASAVWNGEVDRRESSRRTSSLSSSKGTAPNNNKKSAKHVVNGKRGSSGGAASEKSKAQLSYFHRGRSKLLSRKRKFRTVSDGMESFLIHPVFVPHRTSLQPVLPITAFAYPGRGTTHHQQHSSSTVSAAQQLLAWRHKPPPQPEAKPLIWPSGLFYGAVSASKSSSSNVNATASSGGAAGSGTGSNLGGGLFGLGSAPPSSILGSTNNNTAGPRRLPPPPLLTCWTFREDDNAFGCGGDVDGTVVLAKWYPTWQPLMQWPCDDGNRGILACHWKGPHVIALTDQHIECRDVSIDGCFNNLGSAGGELHRHPRIIWTMALLPTANTFKKGSMQIQISLLHNQLLWTCGKGPRPTGEIFVSDDNRHDEDSGLYCFEWSAGDAHDNDPNSVEKQSHTSNSNHKPEIERDVVGEPKSNDDTSQTIMMCSRVCPRHSPFSRGKTTMTCLSSIWDRTAAGTPDETNIVLLVALRTRVVPPTTAMAIAKATSTSTAETSETTGSASTCMSSILSARVGDASSSTTNSPSTALCLEVLRYNRNRREILARADLPTSLGRAGSTSHLECNLQQHNTFVFLSTFKGIHMYETESLTLLQTFGESVSLHGKIVHWQSCCWVQAPGYNAQDIVATKRKMWLEHADELQARYNPNVQTAKDKKHTESDGKKSLHQIEQDWLLVGVPHGWKEPEELQSTFYVWMPGQPTPLATVQAPIGGLMSGTVLVDNSSQWHFMGATAKPSPTLTIRINDNSEVSMMQQLWSLQPTMKSDFAGVQYPVGYQLIDDNIEYIEDEDELDKVVVFEDDYVDNDQDASMNDAVVDTDGTVNHDPELAEALRRSVLEQSMNPKLGKVYVNSEDEPVSVLVDDDEILRNKFCNIPCLPYRPDSDDDGNQRRSSFDCPLSPTTKNLQDFDWLTCLPQFQHTREQVRQLQKRISSLTLANRQHQNGVASFKDGNPSVPANGNADGNGATAAAAAAAAANALKARGKRTRTANVESLLRSSIVPTVRDNMNQRMRIWSTGLGSNLHTSGCQDLTGCKCKQMPLPQDKSKLQRKRTDICGAPKDEVKKSEILCTSSATEYNRNRTTSEHTDGTHNGNVSASVLQNGNKDEAGAEAQQSTQEDSNVSKGPSELDTGTSGSAVDEDKRKAGMEGNFKLTESVLKEKELERRSPSVASKVSAEEKELAMELLLLSPRPGSIDGGSEKPPKSDKGDESVSGHLDESVKPNPSDAVVTPSEQSPTHVSISSHIGERLTKTRKALVSCPACSGRMVIHQCGKREKPIDYEAIERAERERREREEAEKQRLRIEKRRAADQRRREARRKKKEEEERLRKEEEERLRQLEAERIYQASVRDREEVHVARGKSRANGYKWKNPNSKQGSISSTKETAPSDPVAYTVHHSGQKIAKGHSFVAEGPARSPGYEGGWKMHSQRTNENISDPRYGNSEVASTQQDYSKPHGASQAHYSENTAGSYTEAYSNTHALADQATYESHSNAHSYDAQSVESRQVAQYGYQEHSHPQHYMQDHSHSISNDQPAYKNEPDPRSYYGHNVASPGNVDADPKQSAALSTSDALEALAGLANSMPAAPPSDAAQSHNFSGEEHYLHSQTEVSGGGLQMKPQRRLIPSYDQIRASQQYEHTLQTEQPEYQG